MWPFKKKRQHEYAPKTEIQRFDFTKIAKKPVEECQEIVLTTQDAWGDTTFHVMMTDTGFVSRPIVLPPARAIRRRK